LEMVLLRALAFRPDPRSSEGTQGSSPALRTRTTRQQPPGEAQATRSRAIAEPLAPCGPTTQRPSLEVREDPPPTRATAVAAVPPKAPPLVDDADWHRLVEVMSVSGLARQLANHCAFVGWDGRCLQLALDPTVANLRGAGAEQRLGAGLASALGCEVKLEISIGAAASEAETPALRRARDDAERQARAEADMRDDPVVHELNRHFDAAWVPGSIRPAD
jgi:DNA polymerase-3 subunit gamma/tau